ncbi:MAG TPA: 2-oxoglutarate dehydrogenase complex dihydrolipoyllysine-residue succinyltransferase [Prolixibacteraceae bacterium]|nr:2-oxoglutarate dehydrogenase complex dihydrolipoyllysine-residue succinyltransferase [Prolixibacteraceae bacterium]
MVLEVKIPTPGESITEVEIGKWLVADGDLVQQGQEVAEVESDKATLTIIAPESGQIKILVEEGQTVAVGSTACTVDTSIAPRKEDRPAGAPIEKKADKEPIASELFAEPSETAIDEPEKVVVAEKKEKPDEQNVKVTPVAHKMMEDNHLSMEEVLSGLHRISKGDIEAVISLPKQETETISTAKASFSRAENKEKMTALRRKLSERLVAVRNETAMLTTFNEIDMSRVMDMRAKLQNRFVEKHGLKFGFMSIFAKAVAEAMSFHPTINSQIDGEEILSFEFVDIGIAVQSPKGLMVPIVRNAESKGIAQIELEIKDLAEKARTKKISVEELTGGTFTITNGGVFGSLLSTPIINPPQSAILGMHNIVDRPVAVNGQVVIRPMMYVALSYDHRIIDGKDSVGFLVKVKELIENPERLLYGGRAPEEVLLDI